MSRRVISGMSADTLIVGVAGRLPGLGNGTSYANKSETLKTNQTWSLEASQFP